MIDSDSDDEFVDSIPRRKPKSRGKLSTTKKKDENNRTVGDDTPSRKKDKKKHKGDDTPSKKSARLDNTPLKNTKLKDIPSKKKNKLETPTRKGFGTSLKGYGTPLKGTPKKSSTKCSEFERAKKQLHVSAVPRITAMQRQ